MNDFLQASQLRDEARRLLRYRIPLMLAVLCNFVFLIRFPLIPAQSDAPPPSTLAAAAVTTTVPSEEVLSAQPQATSLPLVALTAPAGPVVAPPPHEPAAPTDPVVASPQPTDTVPSTMQTDPVVSTPQVVDTVQQAVPRAAVRAWRASAQAALTRWADAARRHADTSTLTAGADEPAQTSDTQTPPAPSVEERQLPNTDTAATASWPHSPFPPIPAPHTLTLHNDRANGTAVRFLVNGRLRELGPGETLVIADEPTWLVQFHRGDVFGNAAESLTCGVYEFVVTERGWMLDPTNR